MSRTWTAASGGPGGDRVIGTSGSARPPGWRSGDRFSLYDRIAEEDPFPYSDRLHEDFLSQFEDEDVRRALLSIPEVYRVPLVLLYTEELRYRELAELLGCPIGTAMSRLHRGRKAIERALWVCARRRGWVKEWTP